MGRRQIKKEVITLLSTHDPESILEKVEKIPRKSLLHPLFTALCNPLEKVRWNAVLCFGRVVPEIAENNFEDARIVMRRFLWMLNDESGGIGWGAPESMAEIMCRHDQLRSEYLHMLISYMRDDGEELFQDGNFLELPLLQRGLLWGIGRLCHTFPAEMSKMGIADDLSGYLYSRDEQVQGMTLWALGNLGCPVDSGALKAVVNSNASLHLFSDGAMRVIPFPNLIKRIRMTARDIT